MLNNKGFDLWADNYDKSVDISDEEGTYPFARYKIILNEIYNRVLGSSGKKVLDIGFGTGTLTSKLYEQGCDVFGQDFSEKMIIMAKKKMPNAHLFQGDMTEGLVIPLLQEKYDSIIATYSLHHLTNEQKIKFIRLLSGLLKDGGSIYIGDVAFSTWEELEKCKRDAGDNWDDDEIYFVYEELNKYFPDMVFEQMSCCAGVLTLRNSLEMKK